MRFLIVRASNLSPSGLSYFAGDITLDTSGPMVLALPRVSFFVEDAKIFPTNPIAVEWADLLSAHAPGDQPFFTLPAWHDGAVSADQGTSA
ncbi:hypothetical protein [Kaistia sp. MMO-174]|uniref:hypothetical protein n=1 Tax=Kaistia sp. MMO-174 TaxID=3081256 RepID=UPI00301A2026